MKVKIYKDVTSIYHMSHNDEWLKKLLQLFDEKDIYDIHVYVEDDKTVAEIKHYE